MLQILSIDVKNSSESELVIISSIENNAEKLLSGTLRHSNRSYADTQYASDGRVVAGSKSADVKVGGRRRLRILGFIYHC